MHRRNFFLEGLCDLLICRSRWTPFLSDVFLKGMLLQLSYFISSFCCHQVAIGQDHTMFLMENASLYGCGSNAKGQLGLTKSPGKL